MSSFDRFVVKQTPNYTVLCTKQQVTILQIPEVASNFMPKLSAFAIKNQIMISGPAIFFYEGECVDASTPVQLTLAIPVCHTTTCDNLPPEFSLQTIKPIKVVSYEHSGAMKNIAQSYYKLKDQAEDAGFTLANNFSCEIYTHWAGLDSPDSRTEIQFKILD